MMTTQKVEYRAVHNKVGSFIYRGNEVIASYLTPADADRIVLALTILEGLKIALI